MIDPTFLSQLIQQVSISRIVGKYVKLIHKGDNHHGLCPFHQESTPSFTVSEGKKFYHCFGCGKHGNVIDFLMAHNQLSFPDAVKHIAAECQMEVIYSSQKQDQRLPFFELTSAALRHYSEQLKASTLCCQYLEKRGLTAESIQHFGLGYAPDQWCFLSESASMERRKKLLEIGMVMSKNGKHYDRFRHRLMFPLRNASGQVLGFSGRSMDDSQPKYLNSPESLLFKKRFVLYGEHESKKGIIKNQQVIVVEGFMDVIQLHQHGFEHAVASSGTALTSQQIDKILHLSNHCVICFDGDTAGKQAAEKALHLFMSKLNDQVTLRFILLPDKHDPDSYLRTEGSAAFQKLLDQATPFNDFMLQILQSQFDERDIQQRAKLITQWKAWVETIPPCHLKELLIHQIQQRYQLKTTPAQRKPQVKKAQPALNGSLTYYLHMLYALAISAPSLFEHETPAPALALSTNSLISDWFAFLSWIGSQSTDELTQGEILTHWKDKPQEAMIKAALKAALPIAEDSTTAKFLYCALEKQVLEEKITELMLLKKEHSGDISQAMQEALQAKKKVLATLTELRLKLS